MIRKPWPIIIVSFIFFVIPIFNILLTYFLRTADYAFSDYIYSLLTIPKNYIHLFNMVIPSLVAGVAVYSIKKWSYPVFLISMLWLTFYIFQNLDPGITFKEIFFTIVIPMAINILYVTYLLLPNVRAVYFNPRLRWWETKPRYIFATNMKITSPDQPEKIITGVMANISEGGLFAQIHTPLEPNSVINLEMEILDVPMQLQAKVVYRKPDGVSHGLQFSDMSKDQKKIIKTIMARFEKDKYEITRQIPFWKGDLANWFVILMKTGKGLIPEIPQASAPRKD